MSLLANVLGFSAFGFATRCFQLGLQKRFMFAGMSHRFLPFLLSLLSHRIVGGSADILTSLRQLPKHIFLTAAGFGAVGWGVYELEQRQPWQDGDEVQGPGRGVRGGGVKPLIEARKQVLLANREKENAEYAQRKAQEGEHAH
ncbi:hypothetical protein QFC20_003570 [Naganishia adeliensis]|uniref:Uncharacterized protein n=1 Tax=Naganishia adeliensis TaxID=92952 RepID=A0ACC2WBH2_9TREE|nr:hypothetical protein QFC20_003570 [Naganishia adeliensis]